MVKTEAIMTTVAMLASAAVIRLTDVEVFIAVYSNL
jgi:hypothetical protein